MALLFFVPGFFVLGTGAFFWPYQVVWLAALLGTAASVRRVSWSLPDRFKSALASWAVVVALGTALVIAREADFTAITLRSFSVTNSGIPVRLIVMWAALTASGLLVGVLWFDYLFAIYGNEPFRRFRIDVLVPLGVGWFGNAVVAIYQWQVDPQFLSAGFWTSLQRATGLVRDANGLGALCALWGPALAALALDSHRQWLRVPLAVLCVALAWAAVWASGSRGAFFIVLVTTLALGLIIVRDLGRKRLISALAVATVLLAGALLGLHAGRDTGPLARIAAMGDEISRSPRAAIKELWARDGYGSAATAMIAAHPVTGVGVGQFHSHVGDYTPSSIGARLPPDNAQNWYRHQLAELGVLGSIGWIAWVSLVSHSLFRTRLAPSRYDLRMLRWILIAFGVIHTVAMPGQELFVAMTFWTFAFWFFSGATPPIVAATRVTERSAAWNAVWILAIANVVLIGVEATGSMRPATRAAQLGTAYSYGFRVNDTQASLTARRGVIVLPASEKWLKLTYWAEHPDADSNRVEVKIWRDDERVIRRRISRNVPLIDYVSITPGKRFILEVSVDRTFPDPDEAGGERGLDMKWEFVDRAPGHR